LPRAKLVMTDERFLERVYEAIASSEETNLGWSELLRQLKMIVNDVKRYIYIS